MQETIVTHLTPKSPVSEAFRNMRTNVLFSDIDNERKVLAITSSGGSEGKSTILANYGVTLCQSGKRVLIVDCDLRKPQIHRRFELNNATGLTNLLLKEIKTVDAFQRTEVPNLFAIVAGPIPPNPSEILASRRMAEIITELKLHFDYILLDTPPLGMVTDAAVLSPVVDGYIVLASLGAVHRDGLLHVLDTFAKINAHVVGIVANKVPVSKRFSKYGYYSAYGYYGNEDISNKKTKKEKVKKEKKKWGKGIAKTSIEQTIEKHPEAASVEQKI
ncbi:CpsD/CapB family tyrosine-protein kinase [Acetobacterium sp.]|uniref:CpsD/CapB family tyrosine-protein kinase n=1 Tax=Acetobacterium sp. TaxID=1872094 RepID=UPI000CA7230A|nr:CpsD/CapB family tyrosine-protein kinase [Acetobacterium sp.]MDO9493736.1 CpsD/CapB family tyrosine-protein kinase [Acetobacterium sp.]PKM75514.1 MAG: capsular biosynthesis protein [Firmicutes bacterium HGW-Firmicutes-17]